MSESVALKEFKRIVAGESLKSVLNSILKSPEEVEEIDPEDETFVTHDEMKKLVEESIIDDIRKAAKKAGLSKTQTEALIKDVKKFTAVLTSKKGVVIGDLSAKEVTAFKDAFAEVRAELEK